MSRFRQLLGLETPRVYLRIDDLDKRSRIAVWNRLLPLYGSAAEGDRPPSRANVATDAEAMELWSAFYSESRDEYRYHQVRPPIKEDVIEGQMPAPST